MDASILEEKELKKYQDLEKLIHEGEEIQFFTLVEFNRVDVLLALTSENFILYYEDYDSFGNENVIRFSRGFVKEVKFSNFRSKLKLIFSDDVIQFKISSSFWLLNAEEMAEGYQHIPIITSDQNLLVEEFRTLEEAFGIYNSINSELDKLEAQSDKMVEFEEIVFDRGLSYKIGAITIFFVILINLLPLVLRDISSYQSNVVPAIFYSYFAIMLWQKKRTPYGLLLGLSVLSLFYFGKSFWSQGTYLNIYFDSIFAISIFLSLFGKPNRKRILFAGLFYGFFAVVVALGIIVKDLFVNF